MPKRTTSQLGILPQDRRKAGYHLKRTSEIRERFYAAWEKSFGNVSWSCAMAGIDRKTYYRWINSDHPADVEFRRRLAEIRPQEAQMDAAEYALAEQIAKGDMRAIELVLKSPKAAARGYYTPPPSTAEHREREQLAKLRSILEQAAESEGISFDAAVKQFLESGFDRYYPRPVVDKLISEAVN